MTGNIQTGSHHTAAYLAQLQAAQGTRQEFAVLLDVWRRRSDDDPAWHSSSDLYLHLAQRFLQLEAAPLAREVVQTALSGHAGLERFTKDSSSASAIKLRQILGLALARSGNPEAAQAVLTQLQSEGHSDEETLGTLARTYKDLAVTSAEGNKRQSYWAKALDLYEETYRRTGGYWPGINVATLACLGGDQERARQVADDVRKQCLRKLELFEAPDTKVLQRTNEDPYWLLATLGEAELATGNFSAAEEYYRRAFKAGHRRFGDLNSTRRQARWLLQYWNRDDDLLDQWLPVPGVVVFAGHMIDRPNRDAARFPPELADRIKVQLASWCRDNHALIGFSSAACGSDILFQEALRDLDGEVHVLLPYDAQSFIQDSVDLIPDSNWVQRYESVIAQATEVTLASPHKIRAGGVPFDYANVMMHGLATLRARQLETTLMGLVVWNGYAGDGPGGTSSVVERCQALRIPVYQLNPENLAIGRVAQPTNDLPGPSTAAAAISAETGGETSVMATLFGDAVNFSQLTEEQVPLFVEHFLGSIARILERYQSSNVARNTWGDGLYLVFTDLRDAGCCALDICRIVNDAVRQDAWRRLGLPADLNMRVALHAGPVTRVLDPVTKQYNYVGAHVSRAARLEPVTPPGEVYASEAFAALAAAQDIQEFSCEYVKQLKWAKQYGTFPTYVVRPK
jgi:class 3 adenylate cyclase